VRAAIEAIELDAGVSSFAIGKIRRVKHSRIFRHSWAQVHFWPRPRDARTES